MKKLTLSRETLLRLDAHAAARVQGGYVSERCDPAESADMPISCAYACYPTESPDECETFDGCASRQWCSEQPGCATGDTCENCTRSALAC